MQTERSVASEFAQYAFTIDKQKNLCAPESIIKRGDGGQAIAPEVDFASFEAQNPLNSDVREAGAAISYND